MPETISIEIEASISEHAALAFLNVYSIRYPNSKPSDPELARPNHGIQHTARTALYIPVLANLYRRYNDSEALLLTDEDIKLLQITALYHDAARESDGEDKWNDLSAVILYNYLTNILKIGEYQARQFADAIAKKDFPRAEKNIYQKLMHDADSLDIMRARAIFKAEYLDFFDNFARIDNQAYDEIVKLIVEVRSLLAFQGDLRLENNSATKKIYECKQAYTKILESIFTDINPYSKTYKVIKHFYNDGKLQSKSDSKLDFPLTNPITDDSSLEEKAQMLLHEGKIFSRGVSNPSAISIKSDETIAGVELRKTLRRRGFATRKGNLNKNGNPRRSISMLGWGSPAYSATGFLIFGELTNPVHAISSTSLGSGRGKKSLAHNPWSELSIEEIEKKLAALLQKIQMGGDRLKEYNNIKYYYNEISYTLTDYDAIYFSNTPSHSSTAANHLGAFFLQNEYRLATKITLPIYEYSQSHHVIRFVPNLTNDEILSLWLIAASEYIINKPHKFSLHTLDEIKILCTHNSLKISDKYKPVIAKFAPVDSNYPGHLRSVIDIAILELINNSVIEQRCLLRAALLSNQHIFAISFYTLLVQHGNILDEPVIRAVLEARVHDTINSYSPPQNLFDDFLHDFEQDKTRERLVIAENFYTKSLDTLFRKYGNTVLFGNKLLKLYVLSHRLNVKTATGPIRYLLANFMQTHLAQLAVKLKSDSKHEPLYEAIFTITVLFEVYHEFRKSLLKMLFHYGVDSKSNALRGADLINLLVIDGYKERLDYEEMFYYIHLAIRYHIPKDRQDKLIEASYTGSYLTLNDYVQRSKMDARLIINDDTKYNLAKFGLFPLSKACKKVDRKLVVLKSENYEIKIAYPDKEHLHFYFQLIIDNNTKATLSVLGVPEAHKAVLTLQSFLEYLQNGLQGDASKKFLLLMNNHLYMHDDRPRMLLGR